MAFWIFVIGSWLMTLVFMFAIFLKFLTRLSYRENEIFPFYPQGKSYAQEKEKPFYELDEFGQ